MKRADNELFRDLEALSESSMGFWVNEIDDEVWELHNIGNHGKDSGGSIYSHSLGYTPG